MDEDDGLYDRKLFYWITAGADEDPKAHVRISLDEVVSQHGVPENEVMTHIEREIAEHEACRGLPFTLLLVAAYSFAAIAHSNSAEVRDVENSLQHDIVENANYKFAGPYMGHKNYEDVNSRVEFWEWMQQGLVPLLFIQERSFHEGYPVNDQRFKDAAHSIDAGDRGLWLNYNRIIGGLRLQQERDQPGECPSPDKLDNLYDSQCYGGHDYNLDPEVGFPQNKAETTLNPERVSWLWIHEDIDVIQKQLYELEASQWLDRSTRKIEIAIPSYNGEYGLHTLTRVNFYFSRGGRIWKVVLPMTQNADWHAGWYYLFYDVIWCAALLYIFITELKEVFNVVVMKGARALLKEYLNIWNAIDWLTVLSGFGIIIQFASTTALRQELNDALEFMGDINFNHTADYKQGAENYVASLETNVNFLRDFKLGLSLYPLVIVFRLFKSFAAQPRLALVTSTLYRAGPDLFHFMIVFVSVSLTFMVCGMVLFGRELRSFTTVPRAAIACFRIMMGDIDWEELSSVGKVYAGIWLWSYMIITVLLMLNMVLAIIMDTYDDVKTSAGSSETLLDETKQLWVTWRGMRNGTHVPLSVVFQALREFRGIDVRASESFSFRLTDFLNRGKKKKKKKKKHGRSGLASRSITSLTQTQSVGLTSTMGTQMTEHILMTDTLIEMVDRFNTKMVLSEAQAFIILKGAASDCYARRKHGAELLEVRQMTMRVRARVSKLTELMPYVNKVRDKASVEDLQWFAKDIDAYLEEVRNERAESHKMVKQLQADRMELRERLLKFSPEAVFRPVAGPPETKDGKPAKLPPSPAELKLALQS